MLKRLASNAGANGGGGGGGAGGADGEVSDGKGRKTKASSSSPTCLGSPSMADQHPQFKDIYMREQPASPSPSFINNPSISPSFNHNNSINRNAVSPSPSYNPSISNHPSGAIPKKTRFSSSNSTAQAETTPGDRRNNILFHGPGAASKISAVGAGIINAGFSSSSPMTTLTVSAETHEEPRDSGVSSISTASSGTFFSRITGSLSGGSGAGSDATAVNDAAVAAEIRHQDIELRQFERQCAASAAGKRTSMKKRTREDRLTQLGWRRDEEDGVGGGHSNNHNNNNSNVQVITASNVIETTAI